MSSVTGTARIVYGTGSMQRSGVCLSVRPSVRPIIRPPHAAEADLLLSARRAGDVDRLLSGAQQHGAQQQMRAVPR